MGRRIGATRSGATLTLAIAMRLTPQRVTTSLTLSTTAMPHAATRTPTLRWRAQPTPWVMLNAQQRRGADPVTPTPSRWALGCSLLGWLPSHELHRTWTNGSERYSLHSLILTIVNYFVSPLTDWQRDNMQTIPK